MNSVRPSRTDAAGMPLCSARRTCMPSARPMVETREPVLVSSCAVYVRVTCHSFPLFTEDGRSARGNRNMEGVGEGMERVM